MLEAKPALMRSHEVMPGKVDGNWNKHNDSKGNYYIYFKKPIDIQSVTIIITYREGQKENGL